MSLPTTFISSRGFIARTSFTAKISLQKSIQNQPLEPYFVYYKYRRLKPVGFSS